MNHVYVLTDEEAYEAPHFMGVFSSQEKAKEFLDRNYPLNEGQTRVWKGGDEHTYSPYSKYGQYEITLHEVDPVEES